MPDAQIPSNQALDSCRWVDDHAVILFGYALDRVGNRDSAEELVQETFVAALGAVDRFEGGSSERTWLIGILKHKILDHYRHQSRQRPLPEADLAADHVDAMFDKGGHWNPKPGH